jgi:drug/metabolite transporter (DMT)-like permease
MNTKTKNNNKPVVIGTAIIILISSLFSDYVMDFSKFNFITCLYHLIVAGFLIYSFRRSNHGKKPIVFYLYFILVVIIALYYFFKY